MRDKTNLKTWPWPTSAGSLAFSGVSFSVLRRPLRAFSDLSWHTRGRLGTIDRTPWSPRKSSEVRGGPRRSEEVRGSPIFLVTS